MNVFKWFESIVLRIKNKRTRRRALTNLGLFAVLAGTIGLASIYTLTYVRSRAESDAKATLPIPVRIEYQSFTGLSAIYAVSKKGMAYSQTKGIEMGARWWKNDVLRAAEDFVDILGVRPEIKYALPNYVFSALVKDKDGRPVHEETHFTAGRSPPNFTERLGRLGIKDPASKFFGLPTTKPREFLEENIRNALRNVTDSPHLRIWVGDEPAFKTGDKAFQFDSYAVHGFIDSAHALGRTHDRWSETVLRRNPQYYDLVRYSAFFMHDTPVAAFEPREVRLLALSIENIGDQAIYSPQFVLRQISGDLSGHLRTEREQESSLKGAQSLMAKPPIDALKPGERLLVPLTLYMTFSNDSVYGNTDWGLFPGEIARFEVLTSASPQGVPRTETVQIDVSALKGRPIRPKLLNERYYFGPSVDVLRVGIQGTARRDVPVRRFDPLNVILQDGDEKGSCPILYAGIGEDAMRLRPVLVNAVTKAGHAVDTIRVPLGLNKFEVRETEPERSFISSAKLIVQGSDGSEQHFSPTNVGVMTHDNPRVLDQGEVLLLKFATPVAGPREINRRIEISGFYVPYSLMRQSSSEMQPTARWLTRAFRAAPSGRQLAPQPR